MYIPSFIHRILKGIAIFIVSLLCLAITAVACFTWWLNSETGSRWVLNQVNSTLSTTDYSVNLTGLDKVGIRKIAGKRLTFADETGNFLIVNSPAISYSFSPFAADKVTVYIDAESLSLKRTPVSKEKTEEVTESIIPAMENAFLNSFRVIIRIKQLQLDKNIYGGNFNSPVNAAMRLNVEERPYDFDLNLTIFEPPLLDPPLFPADISLSANITPENNRINIEHSEIKNSAYSLDLKGIYDLDSSALNLQSQLVWGDASSLFSEFRGPLETVFNLKGSTEEAKGNLSIDTLLAKKRLSFKSPVELVSSTLQLKDLEGRYRNMNLSGTLSYLLDSGLVEGMINLADPGLELPQAILSDAALDGSLQAKIELIPDQKKQQVLLSGTAQNLKYDTTSFKKIDFNSRWNDITEIESVRGNVTVASIKQDEIQIPEAKMEFTSIATGINADLKIKMKEPDEILLGGTVQADYEPFKLNVDGLRAHFKEGVLNFSGDITEEHFDLKLVPGSINLALLSYLELDVPVVLDGGNITLTGKTATPEAGKAEFDKLNFKVAEGTVKLSGSADKDVFKADVSADNLLLSKLPAIDFKGAGKIASIRLQASGQTAHPFQSEATLETLDIVIGKGSIKGSGDVRESLVDLDFSINQVNFAEALEFDFPAIIHSGSFNIEGNLKKPESLAGVLDNFSATVAGGKIKSSGIVKYEEINITAEVSTIDFSALPEESSLPLLLNNGALEVSGSMKNPELKMTATVTTDNDVSLPAEVALDASYLNGLAEVELSGKGSGISSLSGNVSVPVEIALYPPTWELNQNAPLSGKLIADLEPRKLTAPFLQPHQIMEGNLNIAADVSGTVSSPSLNGQAALKNGGYRDENLHFVNIHGDAIFNQQTITVTGLNGEDPDGGSFGLEASVVFDDGVTRPEIDATLALDSLHITGEQFYTATLNGALDFHADEKSKLVSGSITPAEVLITLPDQFEQKIPALNIVEEIDTDKEPDYFDTIEMDISFLADNRIFLHGWGVDAEFKGDLSIEGTVENPQILGSLELLRGRYQEFGKRFDLKQAIVRFNGTMPPSPYLDIIAKADTDDIDAEIQISGPAQSPSLKLTSSPDLPEDEILSRVLFGREMSDITPFQGLQIANTLRKLAGHKSSSEIDPMGTIRSVTGLDDIRIEGAGSDQMSVGAGKYLTDDVYVEVEQGQIADSTAAKVSVELTPNITLESKANQQGSTGAGIFWEWSY